jgi:hypothetical protein
MTRATGARFRVATQVSRETSPAGFSYRTDFPFLTFAGFRLWRTTSRFVAFLGTLSGSYWYAVFRSSLRPTSRDKTYCTHGVAGCQRLFATIPVFLTNGCDEVLIGRMRWFNGISCTPNGGPRGAVVSCPSSA